MTDHTWIAPVGKKGTVEFGKHVVRMHIYAETAGFDNPRLPLMITGRLCALSRIYGPGVKITMKRSDAEAPPQSWTED